MSVLQIAVFLAIAWGFGIELEPWGYVEVLPVLALTGLMLGALGLLISSTIRQLENFAGVKNFVLFPMFFLSTALYPPWKMSESSHLLREICAAYPSTHAVKTIRFAACLRWNGTALVRTALSFLVFMALSLWSYDPARGIIRHRAG